MRFPFIHLNFRHWSLDGSFFVAQTPQFLWTTQFRNGYCTMCVDKRRGSIKYSVFVGKRDSSNWNSLLGMKLGCTNTILRHKRNPWHGSIHGLPPSKNSRLQPALGNWWRQCFGTWIVCFCCTFLPLMKQSNSAAYQATLKKLKRAVQRKRPQMSYKRVLLLHDNARPHTAHATVNLLER